MYTTGRSACTRPAPWRSVVRAVLAALVAAAVGADPAVAWHCGRQVAVCGPCFTPCAVPWVGGCSYRSFCSSGWGFGFGFGAARYRSFACGTPGLWSGSIAPCFVPVPFCGWYPYAPVLFTPSFNCYPGAFAPVYGPAGVYPFLGFGAGGGAAPIRIGRGADVNARQFAARDANAVRASNPAARLRAARLVAVGDRHLRAAVRDPAKLRAALGAYRRAEAIAADQPEILLRQAIVLTALDDDADAAAAVNRAVAIDGRLAEAGPPVPAAERLPPDPAFGDRPAGAPSLLAERSHALLADILAPADAGADQDNWIVARWSRRVRRDVLVAANQ